MTISAQTKPLPRNEKVYCRQIAFAAAFLLPAAKLLEAPSILAKYASGDLLLPALAHFLLQSLLLLGFLYAASRSEIPLFVRLQNAFGGGVKVLYIAYVLYYLFSATLPLLDLEKFVYAAFFDTAPTTFAFGVFFFLSAFICTKGIKAVGRSADLCLFLFLLPFSALMAMSFTAADFSNLLPFFGTKLAGSATAFSRTAPQFADALLLLPLIGNCRYKPNDGKKILLGYWSGAALSLLFFAIFYAIYSSIAPREHYAFSKIAEYFPALAVMGRIDLLFVYFLTVVLLLYTCLPLQYATDLIADAASIRRKTWISAALNVLLFLFVLYMNKYYDSFHAVIGNRLFWVFWLFSLLPLLLIFLPASPPASRRRKKEAHRA